MPESVFESALVTVCDWACRLGGDPGRDAWRAVAERNLGQDASRFSLAVLGLRLETAARAGDDARVKAIMRALATFLRDQPAARLALEWQGTGARRVTKDTADLCGLRFDVAGRLLDLDVCLDETAPMPSDRFFRALLIDLLTEAHDATRATAGGERASALSAHVASRLHRRLREAAIPSDFRGEALRWMWRVLTSVCVTFERVTSADDARRLVLPDASDARSLGSGGFDLRVRLVGDEMLDVWASASPAAVDAAVVNEMLGALAAAWGREAAPLAGGFREMPVASQPQGDAVEGVGPTLPSPSAVPLVACDLPSTFEGAGSAARSWSRARRVATQRDGRHAYAALELVDLGPFLETRRSLGDVSPTAMLLWLLARQPTFAGRAFAVMVDVPARGGDGTAAGESGRTPAILRVRPVDYFPGAFPGAGFDVFKTVFEREAALTRERRSASWEMLRTLARLDVVAPMRGHPALLSRARDAFGTVGVFMVRGADVFDVPWHPMLSDGSVGLGDFGAAVQSGEVRCAVTFKGARRQVEACRAAVLAALDQPGRCFSH